MRRQGGPEFRPFGFSGDDGGNALVESIVEV
jgi:hypothetical protein